MSQDAFGNYQAAIYDPTAASNVIITGNVGRGHGPPDASVPTWLQFYIDEDSCSAYANCDGTASGWFLITASVSGVTGVYAYAGADPNGHVTATGPAICTGSGTYLGALWVKTSAGTSNNEWTEVIASANG